MHETAIVSSILSVVLDSLAKHSGAEGQLKVSEIFLEVGLLSCIEPQTLKGCFEIMAEGTAAEGAVLNISVQPLPGNCKDCGVVETNRRSFECPICGKNGVDWQTGQGMIVNSIKVAQQDPAAQEENI